MAEAFGAFFKKEGGLISGFEACRAGELVAHLQFANDTISFSSTRSEVAVTLKRSSKCFQIASGLKINFSKCF